MPTNISSATRARAFLWLCFHYLDSISPNPFADVFSKRNPGKIPLLKVLTHEEMQEENVDSKEEQEFADRMRLRRLKMKGEKITVPVDIGKDSNSDDMKVANDVGSLSQKQVPTDDDPYFTSELLFIVSCFSYSHVLYLL